MNYTKANELLQGRNYQSRKLANNTYLKRRGENIAVLLHTTDIVTFEPNGDTVLNSGGWLTSTTKARMNRYIAPIRISQVNGRWFLFQNGKSWAYADGIILKGGD